MLGKGSDGHVLADSSTDVMTLEKVTRSLRHHLLVSLLAILITDFVDLCHALAK